MGKATGTEAEDEKDPEDHLFGVFFSLLRERKSELNDCENTEFSNPDGEKQELLCKSFK